MNQPLPIVTIAITSGTGSEINSRGVISKTDTHEKIGFGGVDALKTSDYGVRRSEAMILDINARETMGVLGRSVRDVRRRMRGYF